MKKYIKKSSTLQDANHKKCIEYQKSKIKMQNDKLKFKKEFKSRLYQFILKLIDLIEKLPKDRVCFILGDQLLRDGTSILENYYFRKLY